MSFRYEMGCRTDAGPRPRNEDAVHVDPTRQYAVVADGMGGAAGGATASKMAVDLAVEFLERSSRNPVTDSALPDLFGSLVRGLNDQIHDSAETTPALRGMGTTIVLVLFVGEQYCAVNVGDSRAYRIRDGEIRQLSRDHSLVQARVEAGLITAAEAPVQPDRNVITRALGIGPTVEPDFAGGELREGDVFVLTSDGVHGVLTDEAMMECVSQGSPQAIATRLVETALGRGTRDNATAAVVRVERPPRDESDPEFDQLLRSAFLKTRKGSNWGSLTAWIWALMIAFLALGLGVLLFPLIRGVLWGTG
jgi:protein phosphatase